MEGLDEINRKKQKFYRQQQKKIDSDPAYRQSIINARNISIERMAKTRYMTNYDDFLADTFLMTLPPKERDAFFERYANMSLKEFFNL